MRAWSITRRVICCAVWALTPNHERPSRDSTGIRQVELDAADECCGFGGLFAVKHADISSRMLDRKIDHILELRRRPAGVVRSRMPAADGRRLTSSRREHQGAAPRRIAGRGLFVSHAVQRPRPQGASTIPIFGGALQTMSRQLTSRRALAFQSLAESDSIRDLARKAKLDTLRDLAANLERFERRLAANGAHVHWAETGADANRIVARSPRSTACGAWRKPSRWSRKRLT